MDQKNPIQNIQQKLNKLFNDSINLLSEYPEIGRTTNDGQTRISIVRDYLIFYDFNEKELIIQSMWDARRDEEDTEFDYT